MQSACPLLTVRAVNVKFGTTRVLRGATLVVGRHERLAVVGPSGSGKSTLLYTALGLVAVQAGSVEYEGSDLLKMSDTKLSAWRRTNVGIVFQFGHLVREMTVAENVAMPLLLTGTNRRTAAVEATELINHLGLANVADRFPDEISGGELQRVAVARAAVHKPKIIVADEPTGALDSVAGKIVLDLLMRVTGRAAGAALVMVTHDLAVARRADRILTVKDGRTDATEVSAA